MFPDRHGYVTSNLGQLTLHPSGVVKLSTSYAMLKAGMSPLSGGR